MAGVLWTAATAEVALANGAAKTILQVVAATNQRLKIKKIGVTIQGIAATDVPHLTRILRQTTAGTMTALTPKKVNNADTESLQVTAQHTATAEPTAGDVLISEHIHPQGGREWAFGPGEELIVPGGGRLGVEITGNAATYDCYVWILGEE